MEPGSEQAREELIRTSAAWPPVTNDVVRRRHFVFRPGGDFKSQAATVMIAASGVAEDSLFLTLAHVQLLPASEVCVWGGGSADLSLIRVELRGKLPVTRRSRWYAVLRI